MAGRTAVGALLGAEAAPVVCDDEAGLGAVDVELDPHRARVGMREHVAHGLLGHPVDDRLLVAAEPVGAFHPQFHRGPALAQRADEVAERRLETGGREVGRVKVDEERPQVAHGAAQALDRLSQLVRVPRRAVGLGALRERRE